MWPASQRARTSPMSPTADTEASSKSTKLRRGGRGGQRGRGGCRRYRGWRLGTAGAAAAGGGGGGGPQQELRHAARALAHAPRPEAAARRGQGGRRAAGRAVPALARSSAWDWAPPRWSKDSRQPTFAQPVVMRVIHSAPPAPCPRPRLPSGQPSRARRTTKRCPMRPVTKAQSWCPPSRAGGGCARGCRTTAGERHGGGAEGACGEDGRCAAPPCASLACLAGMRGPPNGQKNGWSIGPRGGICSSK